MEAKPVDDDGNEQTTKNRRPTDAEIEAAGAEHRAKHETTEWLESHGATVWWEEANPWGHELFTIDRGGHAPQSRPDLVLEIDRYTFAVEYKPGNSKGGVYDALTQLHGYWASHIAHGQAYLVGDRAVEIDGFLTAAKHSRYGRLFAADVEGEPLTLDAMDDDRASCVEYGQLPPREFAMTEQHCRSLWRLAKRTLENVNVDVARERVPNVGVLLSSHLEVETFDPRPAVLWNRGDSGQGWEVIGE